MLGDSEGLGLGSQGEPQAQPSDSQNGPQEGLMVSQAPERQYEDGELAPQPLNEEIVGGKLFIPEMTEEETYRNYGTWGKPLVRIDPPKGTSIYLFRDVLAGAYHSYLNGDLITPENVAKLTGLVKGTVAKVLASQEMRLALKARGVMVDTVGLTHEMDMALQIIMDPHDGLTFQKKLKKANISNAKYQSFLRNPAFKRQVDNLGEALIANKHEALLAIAAQVGQGNLKAAQLQLEINERYNPRKEQTFDAYVIMQSMFEIMSRHIRDPDTLKAIAQDMRALANDAVTVTETPGLQQTIIQNLKN